MTVKHVALLLAAFAGAAPVNARCWSDADVAAARTREFETMLMVSALRCRTSGAAFLDEYNSFVRTSRSALGAVNTALRGHFDDGRGDRATLDAYDGYVTAIANRYGAGSAGLSCDDFAWITHAAIATEGSADQLAALAERTGIVPNTPEGLCTVGGGGGEAVIIARR